MKLQELADAVKSNYTRLQESEIVGRIMVLSGRNFSRSMAGMEMLKNEGLIENFVDENTVGKLQKMIQKNPAMAELCDALDLVPGKMTSDAPKAEQKKLKKFVPSEIRNNLNLDDGF